MKIAEIPWNDEFKIDVDYVDNAHRKLFQIMNRIREIMADGDEEKNKRAIKEAVKYLENYTETHFMQEEAYMREIGYPGLEMHKKLHDNLRFVTLPALKADLESMNYSETAMSRFVAIFSGWLTGHIMIEDRAISGKVESRYKSENVNEDDKERNALIIGLYTMMHNFFDIDVKIINEQFAGEPLPNAIYYEMNFGKKNSVIMISEREVILKMAERLLGTKEEKITKDVMVSYVTFSQSIAKWVMTTITGNKNIELASHKSTNELELSKSIREKIPDYSMEWDSPFGKLALVVRL